MCAYLRASLLLSTLQVTLFGQSAGSMSVATLYLSAGLENYGVRGAVSAHYTGWHDIGLTLWATAAEYGVRVRWQFTVIRGIAG